MKTISLLCLALLMCAVPGCKRKPTPTPSGPSSETPTPGPAQNPKAYKEFVSLSVSTPRAEVDAPTTATLTWVAKPPYKWNGQFQASLKLTHFDGVTLAKSEFTGADFKVDKKATILSVPFTPKRQGKVTVSGLASLSVCTESLCKVLREQKVELSFTIN